MRLRHTITGLLVGLMLVAGEAAGVNRLLLRRLPAEKGWPEGEVNSIVRDAEGCVWIGTAEGVTCFDGEHCHTYRIEGRRSDGQDNSIHRLMLDSQGRLWMKAGKEYLYLDRRRKAFARNVEELWRRYGWTDGPDVMATDAQGHLFAARDGEGLYALDSDRRQGSAQERGASSSTPQWSYPDELKGLEATDLAAEGERLWVAFSDGTVASCHLMEEHSWTICRQISRQVGSGVKEELKLMADRQGDLWAYCIYGVWHYDAWQQEMSCVTRTDEGDFVRVMAQDAMHRIWVGRDKSGLSVMEKSSGQGQQLEHDVADSRSLPSNTITALACSADSAVIIGTYKGGMALYHPHLYLFDKEIEGEVNALTESPQGHITVGNDQGVMSFRNKGVMLRDKGLGIRDKVLDAPENIVCMLYGRDSTLWVGSFRGGLTALHGEQHRNYRHTLQDAPHQASGLANDNVWALAEDSCGAIWIATLGGGLQRLQPATGEWSTFSRAQGGLADDYLSSLSPSRRGGLWIGMASKGFAFISYDSLRITNYSGTLQGDHRLHSPYINQLCEDAQGWLWLATRNGVEIYLPDEDQLLSLPLPPECTTFAAAVAEDHEGTMWIALGRELLRVETDRRERRFHTRLYGLEEGLTAGVLNQRALCCLSDGRMAAGGTEGLCTFHPQVMKSHYTLRVLPSRGMTQGGAILTIALLLLAAGTAGAIAYRARQGQQRRRQARSNSQRPVTTGPQHPQERIVPHLSGQEVKSVDEQFVARATCYVEANMQRSELSVEELSQELAMSRGHLHKRLTQLTGMTPVEFIRTIRMQRATQLLKHSGMSVAEVAYAVGFNNPKYFSRYFKEAYGILPSAYRNNPDEKQKAENITSDDQSEDN